MNRKPRILVVGSFVMDLIVRADRFVQPGETILGTGFSTASGGKGANQAMQAALLGAQVSMVGCVGKDDFGRQMLASLRGAGVDVSHVTVTDRVSSAVGNVQIACQGGETQNRIVVFPGANMAITPEDVAFLKDGVQDFDLVMLQLEIPMEINALVASYAHAKGVPVMLNPAPSAPLEDSLLRCLTYFSPNEHEAADYVGFPLRDETDVRRAVRALAARGVQHTLITRGENGSALSDQGNVTLCPCVPCEHVADPTAAGDSYVGAFCFGVAAGLTLGQAMTLASHTASITVSRMGAQPSLPTLDMVLELMRRTGTDTAPLTDLMKGWH